MKLKLFTWRQWTRKEATAEDRYCRALLALVVLILSQPMLFAEGATFPEINCCKQFNQLINLGQFNNSLQIYKNACPQFLVLSSRSLSESKARLHSRKIFFRPLRSGKPSSFLPLTPSTVSSF